MSDKCKKCNKDVGQSITPLDDYCNCERHNEQQFIEFLAKELHMLWSLWYKHQRDYSTVENVKRWEEQSQTSYEDLTDDDKDKDIRLAKGMLSRWEIFKNTPIIKD